MEPLAVLSSGMVTAVGMTAPSTCAAIRCGIDNFTETRFIDSEGEWIIGGAVPLDQPWCGRQKLIRIIAPAIRECLSSIKDLKPENISLLLCVSEPERRGRVEGLDDKVLEETQTYLESRFHELSGVISRGRISGAIATQLARKHLEQKGVDGAIIAGADSFLVGATLSAYEEKERLLTSNNSNGFIPGEAGAAVLLGIAGRTKGNELQCLGVGFGLEKATIDSEEPFLADGMVEAIRSVVADSGKTLDEVDYRITDLNGEQYVFKEASLAISRTLRNLKSEFDIWHPADCIGEVGAAIVPCALGVALDAARKGYAPGRGVLCHFGNDDGARAAMILKYTGDGAV